MATPREQLQAMLDGIAQQIPRLLRETPDRDEFWSAFADLTDPPLAAAGPEDFDWVSARITEMLAACGVTPPEA